MSKRVNWKKLRKNIPNQVQVDNKTFYEVLWTDDFVDGKTLGETRHDLQQIVIKNGMNDKETVSTYCHELAHLFSDVYNFSMTEKQIVMFEMSLTYLLKPGNIFSKSLNEKRRVKRKGRKKR